MLVRILPKGHYYNFGKTMVANRGDDFSLELFDLLVTKK